MNLVEHTIDHIINGPTDISDYALKLAFDNPNSKYSYSAWGITADNEYSVEQGIREKIIYKMIGPKLNVNGGVTETIDLSSANVQYMGNGELKVSIPDALTGGREVISIVNVYPGNLGASNLTGYNQGGANCGVGAIATSAGHVLNGLATNSTTSTFTEFTRLGRNKFLIRNAGMLTFTLLAKVILSYDDQFSIISPRHYKWFEELVELGTKAYIYRNCRRGLREAVERFGYSLDDMRDEIDGYSDAHREFKTLMDEHIIKVLRYADPKGKSDHIKSITPTRFGG